MIGNDIIDLQTAAAESNWRRPGYLGKIFTPQEQDWILQSADPAITVWYLWSAKEAVYKIVNRATRERKYAPLAYACTEPGSLIPGNNLTISSGTLLHASTTYYFQSHITPHYIHTIAVTHPSHFSHLAIITDPSILYQKDAHKMPMMDDKPVSVSHHGRYYAMVKALI